MHQTLHCWTETLWSSKRTDNRGRQWENYLADNQELLVANIGDNFTFMSHRGQTIIDVTMASPQLHDKISQWGVVDTVAVSDHLSIEMILHLEGAWTTKGGPLADVSIWEVNVNWARIILGQKIFLLFHNRDCLFFAH